MPCTVHLRRTQLCLTFALCTALAASAHAQQPVLADAPSTVLEHETADAVSSSSLSSGDVAMLEALPIEAFAYQSQTTHQEIDPANAGKVVPGTDVDANGNPIPLDRQQPKRILGFMPNFRSVSAGAKPHPPGWNYNFKVATRQAFDYSSFIFLGLTTVSAYATDSHPSLDSGDAPFYAYLWRGLLDKTDGTYLGGWLLPSLLHQDNRFYPLGSGHRVVTRVGYVMSRQVVTRTYGGHQTFNISGLGGKVLTQYISRFYYPANSSGFSVLATKFAYSAMRDIGFSSIREFYPDIAAHYIKKHREKMAQQASARDTAVPATN